MAGAFWMAGRACAGGVTRMLASSLLGAGASFLLGIFLGCSRIGSAAGMAPPAGPLSQQLLSQPQQSRWNKPRSRPRSSPLPQECPHELQLSQVLWQVGAQLVWQVVWHVCAQVGAHVSQQSRWNRPRKRSRSR